MVVANRHLVPCYRGTVRAVLVGLAVVCGCYSGVPAAGAPCSIDGTCPSGLVCDPLSDTCVTSASLGDGGTGSDSIVPACTDNSMCNGATPVCATTGACRGCLGDIECASGVCSESTGTCIAASSSLFVTAAGVDNATCDQADPCATVSHAITLVDATRYAIAVGDGTYSDSFIIEGPANVLISGAGAKTSGNVAGPGGNATFLFTSDGGTYDHVIEVRTGSVVVEGVTFAEASTEDVRIQGGASLALYNVDIQSSKTGAIDCAGSSTVQLVQSIVHGSGAAEPAVMVAGGMLVIERSQITNNAGGGIRVSASALYDITNSFITLNGGATTKASGVDLLNASIGSTNRFAFNTVAENQAGGDLSVDPGAECGLGGTLADSIFAGNAVSTTCAANYSLADTLLLAGNNNLVGDPQFVGATNFHLGAGSPAIDRADPASTNAIDFDGDARPNGSASDIGADEYVQQ